MLEITGSNKIVLFNRNGVSLSAYKGQVSHYEKTPKGLLFYRTGKDTAFVQGTWEEGISVEGNPVTYETVDDALSEIGMGGGGWEEDMSTLQTAIGDEAAARDEAIATHDTSSVAHQDIQGVISNEVLDRIAADATLQGNINAEASARSAVDTTLQNNIDAEAQARDAAIAAAILTTQKWVASVQTIADLPDPSTFDHTENYLCRVIDDPDKTKDGVYQLIAGSAAWTYFSDNLDFIDETELEEAISAHNTATAAHQDIRTAVSNEAAARDKAIATHNTSTAAHSFAVTDASASSTLVAITSKSPVSWIQEIRNNLKYLLSLFTDGKAKNAVLADKTTQLATPRTINGVSFNGTANITIEAVKKEDLNTWVDVPYTAEGVFSTSNFRLKYNTLLNILWFDFQGNTVSTVSIGMVIMTITLPRSISNIKRFVINLDRIGNGITGRVAANMDINTNGKIQLFPLVLQGSGAYPDLNGCNIYGNAYVLLL